jgi:hypothetical protein
MLEVGMIETRRLRRAAWVIALSSVSRSHSFPWRGRLKPRLLSFWYCRFQLHEPVSACCGGRIRSGEALWGRSNPVPTGYYKKQAVAESIWPRPNHRQL